jgi:hypothetical protein
MFKIGERVIKGDQRGTVVAVQGKQINVIWDNGDADVTNALELRKVGAR